jgi:hypothetical protein
MKPADCAGERSSGGAPGALSFAPALIAAGPRKEISALHAKVSRIKYPHKARIGGFGAKTYASDSFLRVPTVFFPDLLPLPQDGRDRHTGLFG